MHTILQKLPLYLPLGLAVLLPGVALLLIGICHGFTVGALAALAHWLFNN